MWKEYTMYDFITEGCDMDLTGLKIFVRKAVTQDLCDKVEEFSDYGVLPYECDRNIPRYMHIYLREAGQTREVLGR